MDLAIEVNVFEQEFTAAMAPQALPESQDPGQSMEFPQQETVEPTGFLHEYWPNGHTYFPFYPPGTANPLVDQTTAQSVAFADPFAPGPTDPALGQDASEGMEYIVIDPSASLAGQEHPSLGPSYQYGAAFVPGPSQEFAQPAPKQLMWEQFPLQQAQQSEPQYDSGTFESFIQTSGGPPFQDGASTFPGPSQGLTAPAQPQRQPVPAVPQEAHQQGQQVLGAAQGAYTAPASSVCKSAAYQPPQLADGRRYELEIVEHPLGGRNCGLDTQVSTTSLPLFCPSC